ncbi:MAG: hypothetical protein Q9221_006709 [Calogaya cf. arnoldii]
MAIQTSSSVLSPRSAATDRVGAKKRGWPKGQPRKGRAGPWVPAPKGKKTPRKRVKAQLTKFPLMELPTELRANIFSLALPKQNLESHGWATMDNSPNDFMNLLLVNQQVSDEARKVLYGSNMFTMIISEQCTLKLGFFDLVKFLPFQAPPSLPYVKRWQIALWPHMEEMAYGKIQEAVFSACTELAKTPNL